MGLVPVRSRSLERVLSDTHIAPSTVPSFIFNHPIQFRIDTPMSISSPASNVPSDATTAPTVNANDPQVWNGLKLAIAQSSGFERWQQDCKSDAPQENTLDALVHRYLRETLETLAY
jgi:hypothetical protein